MKSVSFNRKAVIIRLINSLEIVTILLNLIYVKALPSPTPEVHVDGYRELEEPFYPFQQYIQVRKTYTVEHVPVYDEADSSSSPPNLSTAASTSTDSQGSSRDYQAASTSHGGSDEYHVPRLREEIDDYKKHEVYEEKGYGDSDYDHHSYTVPSRSYNNEDNDNDNDYEHEASSSKRKRYFRPYRRSLHTPDGSSSKILEYVASNLHDTSAHQKGIYEARRDIYCPEVIDFDLSSKSMKMGQGGRGGAKPRLKGLGSKIKCLKEKYFGREPLPREIFSNPSESRHAPIEVPSFNNFFDQVKRDVDSSSSFQNSKVPDWK